MRRPISFNYLIKLYIRLILIRRLGGRLCLHICSYYGATLSRFLGGKESEWTVGDTYIHHLHRQTSSWNEMVQRSFRGRNQRVEI